MGRRFLNRVGSTFARSLWSCLKHPVLTVQQQQVNLSGKRLEGLEQVAFPQVDNFFNIFLTLRPVLASLNSLLRLMLCRDHGTLSAGIVEDRERKVDSRDTV